LDFNFVFNLREKTKGGGWGGRGGSQALNQHTYLP
jgi:hypothetical protein